MHMFYNGGYSMGGMHCGWWIFWILLIGVIAFYGWGRSNKQRNSSPETPYQILRRRLADGQLTPEEYESRKALLDSDRGKP
jgi:putative membrane protein